MPPITGLVLRASPRLPDPPSDLAARRLRPGFGMPPVFAPVEALAVAKALMRPPRNDLETRRLGEELKIAYAADEVILCGSGTQALQLAMGFARVQSGREEVALPGYTCYDLVSAAVGAEARPVFYDIDPDTLSPDPSSVRRALVGDPAALVVVHHFGFPAPLAELMELAETPWIIEDAAQAQGGSVDGRPLGSVAPLAVLSFGRGKGWTGGGGGALLLRGAAADAAGDLRRQLAPAGDGTKPLLRLAGQWLLGRPSLYGIPSRLPWLGLGETHYHPPTAPAAMPEAVARLVRGTAAAARAEAEARRARARQLRDRLDALEGVRIPPERGDPGYLRLPVRVQGRPSHELLGPEAKELGILPSYPRPLPDLPVVPGGARSPVPGARTLARELFTLPTHSLVGERDEDRMIAALERAIR